MRADAEAYGAEPGDAGAMRVAVVDGGAPWVRVLLLALEGRGDAVALATGDPGRARAVERELPAVRLVRADPVSADGAGPLAATLTRALGGLDVLIEDLSAPARPDPGLERTGAEAVAVALERSVLAPFRRTHALLPTLRDAARERGRALVLHVVGGSTLGALAGAGHAASSRLARAWDEELLVDGVRVRVLDPSERDEVERLLGAPAPREDPIETARRVVDAIDVFTRPATDRALRRGNLTLAR